MFATDAQPEVYIADAATEDERYYVPFTDTVSSRPLWIVVRVEGQASLSRGLAQCRRRDSNPRHARHRAPLQVAATWFAGRVIPARARLAEGCDIQQRGGRPARACESDAQMGNPRS